MAADSTTAKPPKPYPDFPLFPHATRRWAKKIRGKLHYFGPWGDWSKALDKWKEQRDDLLAGKTPRPKGDGLTVKDATNDFLTEKDDQVRTGEMNLRTWNDYAQSGELMVKFFGADRRVDDLQPADFSELRAHLAKGRRRNEAGELIPIGTISLANHVRRIRIIFRWLSESRRIPHAIWFGPGFKEPNKKAKRRARQARPPRLFTAAEIRRLIDGAGVPMKAMILLGINAAMGNNELALLPQSAIDFEKRMLDFPRPKTSIDRRVPLWRETVEAVQTAIAIRPKPKNEADNNLAFLTRFGRHWVRYTKKGPIDSVGLEFGKLLTDAGIERAGVAFYALRHTFETIAGETGDQAGVDRIMGHTRDDMASVYREWTKDAREDARLKKITTHVHKWLFAKKK